MQFTFCCSLLQKLIRKDGDYHSSRMMDGKDIQANQNMQPKKKHKKSGSSIKVKEKVEVGTGWCLLFYRLFIHLSLNGPCCCQHLLSAIDMDDDSSLKVQKNFICDHCYGAFRSSYHLKRHILTHTGEHSFPENVSIHYHLRRAVVLGLRAGEKPYACDACDMRFIQRYHLDRHKRVHSGEKPYQCDRCHQVGLESSVTWLSSCWGAVVCFSPH